MANRVNFTYEDFEEAARNAGLLGQFSAADLQMARQDPNYGMSTLTNKQNWNTAYAAGNQVDMDAAHAAQEALRKSYGNYSGGRDGSGYTLESVENRQADATRDQIRDYQPFSYDKQAPSYVNQYNQLQNQLLNRVTNPTPFSWSPDTDPLYGSYRKQYLREGDRATANALGQAAAATGGRPSTYAVQAATQAGDYYASKAADILPQLYQMAYERWLQGNNQNMNALNAVNALANQDYNRYLTELGQYNTDRSFAYNQWNQGLQNLQNSLQNYERADQNANALTAQERQEAFQAQQYRDRMTQQELENQRQERQYQDQQTQQADTNRRALAQLAAQYGDYSLLEELGISPDADALLRYTLAGAGRTAPVGSGGTARSGGASGVTGEKQADGETGETSRWSDVIDWVRRYGDKSAENYIKAHYKELGYSSQSAALAGWENYNTAYGGTSGAARTGNPVQPYKTPAFMSDQEERVFNPYKVQNAPKLGTSAERIKQTILVNGRGSSTVADDIEAELVAGRITEEEADYLLRLAGA